MLIPIPVATRHVAAAQGTIWKFVTCEQCRQPYAYLLELEATGEDVDLFDVPQIWVATVALALAGLSILIRGCAMSLRFDPNMGDPAPRRALGQRHAVWGERLSEVPATHPSSESGL